MHRLPNLALRLLRMRYAGSWRRRVLGIRSILQTAQGEAHLTSTVEQLEKRLASIDVASVTSDVRFAKMFASGLVWLAAQVDITARGSKVRAYCDIGASLAVLEFLLPEIAAKASLDESDAALAIAAHVETCREALIAAGRRLLARGRTEEAVTCARRALAVMTSCPISQRLLMDALRERARNGAMLTAAERNGLADLRGRFCPRPFEVLVSTQIPAWNETLGRSEQVAGATYACDCAAWMPFVTGNILNADSPDDVWNSAAAQEIRRSILDGDYSYCSRTLCPAITNGILPRAEDVTAPRLRRIIDGHETVLTDGPRYVALGHDSSCNLACPSCRTELVMANREQSERLDRGRDRVILPLLANREIALHLTAWGDPFASRHYRSILEALRAPEFDGVRLYLLTNGLGLTRHTWTAMPQLAEKIVELRVSVDAASKETYENVRRPGKWDVIRENLTVMGEMHGSGVFRRNRGSGTQRSFASDLQVDAKEYGFVIAFVVQSANFREMPAFVALGETIGADSVVFQKYYSLGHEAPAVFAAKDVAAPSHPEHHELLSVLRDPALRSPIVMQGFLGQMDSATT